MRTFFIIPGFKHDPKHDQYNWLSDFFKSKGFEAREFHYNWNFKTMSNFTEDFSKYYNKYKTQTNYVLGFSYGAMAGLITADQLRPNKLILCSLSPYFNEDLKKLKPWWKIYIGIHRAIDFKKFEAIEIAKKIRIPTTIIYGSREGEQCPQLKHRCEEVARLIPNAKLIIAQNAPHRINYPSYIEVIKGLFEHKKF